MRREVGSIREYRSGDEEGILKLFHQMFGVVRTMEHWKWQFQNHVQGQGWITLAEMGNEIVAQYCMMRNHLNFMGKEIVVGQSCDTMVRSDQRGKKWFTRLAIRNYQNAAEKGVKAVFGFPNRDSYPGFMRNLGWQRVVNLKCHYRQIGFQKVWGRRVDIAFKYLRGKLKRLRCLITMKLRHKNTKVIVLKHLPADLEDTLKEIRDYEVLSVWKDLSYLRWRYENHTTYNYTFHILYVRESPEGLVVTRQLKNTVAICEFFHRNKNVAQSILLLHYVLAYYSTSPVQKIQFYGYDNGFFDAVFAACGFKLSSYNDAFVFGGRVFEDPELEKRFVLPQNWTVVYGDTDII